ncbi:MAG: DUF1214 domain-containing protein [Actinomycetota bacterium]|nr:DUF1214 domain-containing protein [Actinomycetota bacterium]
MGDVPTELVGTTDLGERTVVAAATSNPFVISHDAEESESPTLDAVIESGRRVAGLLRLTGRSENGESIHKLIGDPLPWDGVSEDQSYYLNVEPGHPVGTYQLTIADVPDGACWSITAYSKNGSVESTDSSMYNINSHTAESNGDGSITVHFGPSADDHVNCLPITDGWNYVVRLYKAHCKTPPETGTP